MDNICRFPKTGNLSDGLSILNFVFERTADFPPKYLTPANYAMNVVVSGSGILHTPCRDYPVSENNVFLTFSAKPYFIENTGNLGYIYVSFIGPRAGGSHKARRVHRLFPGSRLPGKADRSLEGGLRGGGRQLHRPCRREPASLHDLALLPGRDRAP